MNLIELQYLRFLLMKSTDVFMNVDFFGVVYNGISPPCDGHKSLNLYLLGDQYRKGSMSTFVVKEPNDTKRKRQTVFLMCQINRS